MLAIPRTVSNHLEDLERLPILQTPIGFYLKNLNYYTKKIINPNYPIRQIGISFGNVKDEIYEQFDLFADQEDIEKEKRVQEALVHIRNKEYLN